MFIQLWSIITYNAMGNDGKKLVSSFSLSMNVIIDLKKQYHFLCLFHCNFWGVIPFFLFRTGITGEDMDYQDYDNKMNKRSV